MLCAISGESPTVPVASRKSGNIFEKRLIEAHVVQHGTDPVTGEDLTTDDLVELRSTHIAKPRPPTHTSIPSLLSIFQNEWDTLALETYSLRDHLEKTRRELSSALFQHDAAIRTIERLTRERDEARDALSKVTFASGDATNGDAMQLDGQSLSSDLIAKVTVTQEKLAKTRRKRPIPDNWTTAEAIQSFKPIHRTTSTYQGSTAIAVNTASELALLGGSSQTAGIYSIQNGNFSDQITLDAGVVTAVFWAGSRAVIGTEQGAVLLIEKGTEIARFKSHEGAVVALSIHPSGELLTSVGVDKSYVLYDLSSNSQVAKVFTNSVLNTGALHPDGHLLAVGGSDGRISVYDVKSGTNAATFDESGPISALSFSENGTWLAAVVQGSTNVSIWDLRKMGQIKVIEFGSVANSLQWDYTGQFLAIGGPSGVAVQQYSKSSKEWSEILRSATPAVSLAWGNNAKRLLILDAEASITVLG